MTGGMAQMKALSSIPSTTHTHTNEILSYAFICFVFPFFLGYFLCMGGSHSDDSE
jgi:hypothetical protein